MTVAFLFCVEAGRLEAQGLLLARSIRQFAGRMADAPIYAFQPRRRTAVSTATREALGEAHVTLIKEPLNHDFVDYPIANKIFACAWAEANLDVDILAFLDTDTVITSEPAALALGDEVDAAVRPVDRKRFGSTGTADDPNEAHWRGLYRACGVGGSPRVRTTVDRESIRAYFNAGLVATRRRSGLLSQWRDDFLRLMSAGLLPESGDVEFMDQFALATTLGRAFDRVRILPWTYNYPLPLRRLLPAPANRAELRELVHVHYHEWFQRPDYLGLIEPKLDAEDPVYEWLETRLPLEPTIDVAVNQTT